MSVFFALYRALFLLFFFFNDPPPTEISPLSLHAALPILVVCLGAHHLAVRLRQLHADEQRLDPADQEEGEGRPKVQQADPLVIGGREPAREAPPADRKSTRLNSSHDQISYAVFCLKKKKK